MTKPITPAEVAKQRTTDIPSGVVDEWNKAITEAFDGQSAVIKQNAIVDALVRRMECDRNEVFRQHWLDIEEVFRVAGWRIAYDKPGFNESYEATFAFTVRR